MSTNTETNTHVEVTANINWVNIMEPHSKNGMPHEVVKEAAGVKKHPMANAVTAMRYVRKIPTRSTNIGYNDTCNTTAIMPQIMVEIPIL